MELMGQSDAPEYLLFGAIAAGIGILAAIVMAMGVLRKDEGQDNVKHIGDLIREGAMAFLRREYLLLSVFVVIVTVII